MEARHDRPHAQPWDCVGPCAETYEYADQEPLEIAGANYCVGCIESWLEPLGQGKELDIPRIDETLVLDYPGVRQRVDPDLLRRVDETLGLMLEMPPQLRVRCAYPVADETCQNILGTRLEISDDNVHQWRHCRRCNMQTTCMACEAVLTSEDRLSPDCWPTQEMIDYEEAHNSEESLLDPSRDHFTTATGCPRYLRPGEPGAQFDDPWDDPRWRGTQDFGALDPGDSVWRISADLVTQQDIDLRQDRRRQVGGDDNQNEIILEILLHARHLFTLAHNRSVSSIQGLLRGRPHPAQIYERFRFNHHAVYYRYLLYVLGRANGQRLLPLVSALAGEHIRWFELFRQVRPLDIRPSVLRDGCESDFALLELTLRDKLARIYNASLPTVHYVTSANSGMYEAHARHLTRKVFDVARRLSQLALFFDEPGGYSSSISFHIHNALDELEPLFIAIDQFDSTLFIGNSDETGDRSLAHNLALFFTYRLWREKPIELDFTNIANGQRLFRLHFDEMRSAMQEYRCEMHDFPMQWTPSRIEELEGDLSLTRDAIRALTGQFPPDWMLRDRFYALVTDDHHDPSPGEGPLVPIFFHNLEVLSAVRDLSGGIFEIPGGTGSDFHRLTDESPDHSLPDYSDDDQDQGHYYVDPDEQYLRAHGAYEIYRYNQELYRLRDHFLQLGALSSDEFVAEALTLIDHAFRGLVDGDYLHALAEAYEEILVIAGTRYIQDFENLLWGLEILVDLDDLPAEQSWTPFRSDVRHARAEVFSYSSLHFTLHGRLLRELIPRVRAIWETIRNQEMDNQAWRDLVVDLRAEEERRVRARQ